MPELPEVETVRRGLAQNIAGAKLVRITLRRPDLRVALPANLEAALQGQILNAITRRAKYLLFHFSNARVLLVHLGMSGSLVLAVKIPDSYRKHDHVIMEWNTKMVMTFHDPRRFGLMALTDEASLSNHPLLKGLGPEPLDAHMDGERLYALLHKSKSPVKTVIMDQRKLVGVGNIYACEALFRAKILPSRVAGKVTKKEAVALYKAIVEVLEAAIASGGSTLRDYVRSSGDGGYFQHHFNVYGRQKKPCVVCGNPVRMSRQSGRSTFFCSHCQK